MSPEPTHVACLGEFMLVGLRHVSSSEYWAAVEVLHAYGACWRLPLY
jgi:hypothetical protein